MNSAIKGFNSLVIGGLLVSLLPSLTFAQHVRTNLVSNQEGMAPNTDSRHLVNAWGLTQLGTSPFWVSDNVSIREPASKFLCVLEWFSTAAAMWSTRSWHRRPTALGIWQ